MESIIEILTCKSCRSLSSRCVETKCCSKILCETCIPPSKSCPICASPLSYSISPSLRQLASVIPMPCKYCGSQYLQGDLEAHYKHCPLFSRECLFCRIPIYVKDTVQHLSEAHPDFILQYLYREEPSKLMLGEKANRSGRVARLGSNGKYYCGGNMDYPCGCCTNCGPMSGCNCLGCLKLDIELRCLPAGYYVSKTGIICKSTKKGIYCGSKNVENVQGNDGFCGPEFGSRCEACRVVQKNYRFIQAGLDKMQ